MSQNRQQTVQNVTALVLAGGQGRRMQGQDKGLVEVAGRPLINYVIERIRPQVETVLVSANRNQADYMAVADAVVRDDPELGERYAGPLAGVLAGLEYARTEYVFTMPCDTPCLPGNLLPELMNVLQANRADIAYAHDGKRGQPLIMLLRRQLAPLLREWLLNGGRAAHEWIAAQQHCVVQFDAPDAFTNLNTAEDCASFALHGCK